MSDREIDFLRDVRAYVDFAIRNGMTFHTVMAGLGYDVNGLYRYGLDLDAAWQDGFKPKVTGASEITEDSVGGVDELDSIPD